MIIKILSSASQDFIGGYHFYERQAKGVGSYFIDSLYSDIDSLIRPCKIKCLNFSRPNLSC